MNKLICIVCLGVLSFHAYSKEVSSDQLVERDGIIYEIESGKLFSGTLVVYYKNVQLKVRSKHQDGKLNGITEAFYENGQVQLRGKFKDGYTDGLWLIFDEDGNNSMHCHDAEEKGREINLSYCRGQSHE